MTTRISRLGDFTLQWGESVRWDDLRERLYFVDCAGRTLNWLDNAEPPLKSMGMPGLPTGLVLCEDGRLIAALDDGLHVIDVDATTTELFTPYPEDLGGRANDANADLNGNLITGTLNMGPAPGSYWWYSATEGWRQLDYGIGNANGPVIIDVDGEPTLVVADTLASTLYAYPYDGASGRVGSRRVFADTTELGGAPDGACADDRGGVWSCIFGAGKIARYTPNGVSEVIDTGVQLTSDVSFGGKNLDRMFFVSIAMGQSEDEAAASNAGRVVAVDGTGYRGRVEPRFRL